MQLLFNNAISNSEFSVNSKLADVTQVIKKKDPLHQMIYRPVHCFGSGFRHIENKLPPYLCGYRKGSSTYYALLSLTERWIKILDDKGFGGAVLMHLSKAFDSLNPELLIAKLSAYGFYNKSLKLIQYYPTTQQTFVLMKTS